MKRGYQYWLDHFNGQSLYWLQLQSDYVRNYNANGPAGLDYALALDAAIEEKKKNEYTLPRPPRKIVWREEEDAGEVEIVRCGGKGQTIRIVHPPTNGSH